MQINKVIVHEIIKNANESGARCEFSHNVLPIDEDSLGLVETLDERYLLATVTYGVFKDDVVEFFPLNYNAFIKSQTENNFIKFTQKAIANLCQQITNIHLAKGGYFVFADYVKNDVNYFSIFLIRNTKGILFKKNPTSDSFRINSTTHINLEKLSMACRINNQKYGDTDGKYLSFIKHNLPDISEYFINWIAATEIESSGTYVDELYRLSAHIDPPNTCDDQRMSVDEFQKNIYEYVNSRPDGIVNLHQMGLHFYNDEDTIVSFAEANNFTLNSEFKVDKRRMKKFIRIDVKADGVHLRFTRAEYNSTVRLDPGNSDIVIIESAKFANKLREELNSNEG